MVKLGFNSRMTPETALLTTKPDTPAPRRTARGPEGVVEEDGGTGGRGKADGAGWVGILCTN